MILSAGTAIRFKGDNSHRMASEFADSLRGHCALNGSKIVITRRVQIQVKQSTSDAKQSARDRFDEHFPSRRDFTVFRNNGNGQ
jgi:hypothetical protein